MKVIVAGSRHCRDREFVRAAIKESGFLIHEVVTGGAPGVDTIAFDLSWEDGHTFGIRVFPAKWKKHGLKAGPIRNQEMVDYADALIAIPGTTSSGTRDVIRRAMKKQIPVFVKEWAP